MPEASVHLYRVPPVAEAPIAARTRERASFAAFRKNGDGLGAEALDKARVRGDS